MATRFLEREDNGDAAIIILAGETAGKVTPILVDDDDERLKYYDRTNSRVLTLETGVGLTLTPTAAFTLTKEQSGIEVLLNAAAGFAITLPALAAGLKYRFTVGAAFATTDFTVITPVLANTLQGGAMVAGAEVSATSHDTISFVATAEAVGDFVEVWSDGTSWFVNGRAKGAGGITFTAAG